MLILLTHQVETEVFICSGENETYKCELIKDSPPVQDEEPLIFDEYYESIPISL